MKVEVQTSEYLFSHLRAPRGRGSWAFTFGAGTTAVWFHGTYTEARRKAIAAARADGLTLVKVLP